MEDGSRGKKIVRDMQEEKTPRLVSMEGDQITVSGVVGQQQLREHDGAVSVRINMTEPARGEFRVVLSAEEAAKWPTGAAVAITISSPLSSRSA